MAGFGSSEAKATVSLDMLRFAPGQKVRVHIFMDNSACKKPVKSFKVKLSRKISCTVQGLPPFEKEEYLKEEKYSGTEEKTKTNRTLDFDLPSHDSENANAENLHPDMRHLSK